jgi:hypothetical protein
MRRQQHPHRVLGKPDPLPRRPVLRIVYCCLLSTCVRDTECLLCNLLTAVPFLSLIFGGIWVAGSVRWGLYTLTDRCPGQRPPCPHL